MTSGAKRGGDEQQDVSTLLRQVVDAVSPHLAACETAAAAMNAQLAAARERLDAVRRACERLERAAADSRDVSARQLRQVIGGRHAELLDRGDELRDVIADLHASLRRGSASGATAAAGLGLSVGDAHGYRELIENVRDAVAANVPEGATVLVVSRGDMELTRLAGREGWHFPQSDTGLYAGHHPADSDEAVANLQALRRRGASYLVFPSTSFWWLDFYGDLAKHLDAKAQRIWRDDNCIIFNIGRRAGTGGGNKKSSAARSRNGQRRSRGA